MNTQNGLARSVGMTNTTLLTFAAAVALGLSASRADAGEQAASAEKLDIVDTATAAGSFSTLAAALQTAGLVDALRGDGPFTVFAPTDEAFAKLPEGTVTALLRPENRDRLTRILTFHVVAGHVKSSALLAASSAETLSGDAVPFGLRVGDANVTQADIECSNGVIHVIDTVLLPPSKETGSRMSVADELTAAIDRGVPMYNDGDEDGCARVYRETAKRLLSHSGGALADLHRMELQDALMAPTADASAEAWQLREAFDGILADIEFAPRVEAPMPVGFPGPGPVGKVVTKSYPAYRAARAAGGRAFWTLFNHIKENEIAMTAPVEMTMDDGMQMRDMAFLYEKTTQGAAGKASDVAVLDLESRKVLSIGIRGRRNASDLERARKALQQRLDESGAKAAGPWRVLGYNSPMVPQEQQFWELQVPIAD